MKKVASVGFMAALLLSAGMSGYASQHGKHAGHSMPGMHGKQHGAVGSGMGQGMRGGMDGKGMFSMAKMLMGSADALKLTDEQVGKLHRIKSSHAETRRGLMMAMHQEMGELHGVILDPAATEAQLKELAKKHTEGFAKITNDAWTERKEALAVLTAQQRTALKDLKVNQAAGDDEDDE